MSAGTQLRDARRQAGLTIAAVSSRTKIQPWLLQAIERNDFAPLPGGAVRRGFLRAFAREVGLDPEMIVRDYLAEFEAEPEPAPAARPERARPILAGAAGFPPWLAAAASGVLFIGVLYFRADGPQPIEAGAVPATGVAWTEPFADPSVAHARLTTATAGESITARVALDVEPTGPVWMDASADGARVLYRVVGAGERVSLSARQELRVRVGDAGAFRYFINGEPGRPLGASGQVVELRITPDSYRALVGGQDRARFSAP